MKLDFDCLLHRFYVYRNQTTLLTILDTDFPVINPNDILIFVAHLRTCQQSQMSTTVNSDSMSYLKDRVAEFCRCDFELVHFFGNEKFLAKIDFKLTEEDILEKGPIDEPVFGYLYLQKNTNMKDFL